MHQIVDVSWPQRSYHPGAEEAVFVAATSGDGGTLFVQSTFEEDVANARAEGKALGFYHFNGAQSAEASADAFWAAVRAYWRPGDLFALDIESYNGGASPAQSPAWAAAFMNRLAQLVGIATAALRLGIYGNRTDMRRAGWGALEAAGCWLWLAAPGGYPENTRIGEWSHWTVLQYDSAGNLDRDESELTFAQIAGTLTTAAVAATPIQEEDMAQGIYTRIADGEGAGSIFYQEDPGQPLLPIIGSQWAGAAANGNKYADLAAADVQALMRRVGTVQVDAKYGRIQRDTNGHPVVSFPG